ncbi:MAG: hypothetical protein NZ895_06500 [Archaeoglobaceae archaeon]|nr:hypothetical protein [Archaeoglobaceae archaeon]MCX8152295.1 HVO_0476 family zinc finger protein [Archaeoglobaceae archaeon]MDW8013973.1 HVO_0476 family zinc finger protein [Archaeoglobaceae archaeon]
MKQLIYCDTCKEETLHVLVKGNLYRCTICNTFSSYDEKVYEVRAVISSGPRSLRGKVKLKLGELVEKENELIVETEEGHKVGKVTSIELRDGSRSDVASAENISTLWLKDVGEVEVKFSLHRGRVTRSFKMLVGGETEFEVGEVLNIENDKFIVHRVKLINGEVLRKGRVKAKDVKRVYAKAYKVKGLR